MSSQPNNLYSTIVHKRFPLRIKSLLKYVDLTKTKKFLDIGCGDGSALDSVKLLYDWDTYGIEMNDRAATIVRSKGHNIYQGLFENFNPGSNLFDITYSSHVIEHTESPDLFLKKQSEILKPGGFCFFLTPNSNTWEAKYFGKYWGGMHFPRHWCILTPKSIEYLAEKNGFTLLDISYSANAAFWVWTFHSILKTKLGLKKIANALLPSDEKIIDSSIINILRLAFMNCFDYVNLALFRKSSNMHVLLRKKET